MQRRLAAFALVVVAATGISGASAAVIQEGNLRITVLSQVQPYKLPRTTTAPIAVFVAGHIATVPPGDVPPQLERMTIRVNRHGLLRDRGLPKCSLVRIQAASTARALTQCAAALVGSGRFWASIVLPGQRPYPTRGRLLIFNGRKSGRHVLFAHIYTTKPFATSFVVTFAIRKISRGPYGTELSAAFPEALGDWGFVDRIKLTLRRKYTYRGQRLSYFNAGCPAPSPSRSTVFSLAQAQFSFAGRRPITLDVPKSCAVAR
jgi:hypothetical protein